MTSLKESGDIEATKDDKTSKPQDLSELPPTGTSLHKRRRGEPPATLSVRTPQTPSDAEGSSPCTAPTPDGDITDPEAFCENMLQSLKNRNDPLSKRGIEAALQTKQTLESLDQFEKILAYLNEFVTLKEQHSRLMKKLQDVNYTKRLHDAHKMIIQENERLKDETRELELINEALDTELAEYGQTVYDSVLTWNKSLKRTTSRWKGHSKLGGSLLRRQRSRSAGGEESDFSLGSPLRRKSEGIFAKEVEKSKVSNWRKVKAAFKWEKAQWPPATIGGTAAVAAGAMVGAVALAGSSPTGVLANPEPRDSASLTPGSAISLSPNSSCEELRMESGMCRRICMRHEYHDNSFLQAPTQDDSSTSPSPNKLHKSPWVKMKDILHTHRESVKKKNRSSKTSPDVVPARRRSLSDGGDSDAPPALTLTIPSSEELESEGSHPVLRKQRSLELGARPPQQPPQRESKWTRVKRALLTSPSASVPSSPNRHSAFFPDADTEGVSSGCEAGGVREEIARDYAALQTRLGREFSDRRGKLHNLYTGSRPVATEEQLSADFRKKLTEWQRKKGVRQPPPIPARQDLSEDFLRKLDEWNRKKETNSVPAWKEEEKPDEVLVRTSTGLFKFQGISRSFTRKLHEWEKSRGIAPEASTSALLVAARSRARGAPPAAPLTRTQSDGSVAPAAAAERRHLSSLSVNDADDFSSDDDRTHLLVGCDCQEHARSATITEIETEEVCTAAPLVAVSPRHTPQKPVYTYGPAEPRLLCETSAALTGTAVLQPNATGRKNLKTNEQAGAKKKSSREQDKVAEKSSKAKIVRQPSIEEDAQFIRKTIEEIERGSSHRNKEITDETFAERAIPSTSKSDSIKNLTKYDNLIESTYITKSNDDTKDENKRKDSDKGNGKKKAKSRARLEREQSKPSESDSEPDVDTVTVEIPRRRKRPRRPSERPRTPPTSLHSDTEGEIFVLKLKTPEHSDVIPEVIVKTTRKIFSPVVRSGESVPRAVIPVSVEDLDDVRPTAINILDNTTRRPPETSKKKVDPKSKSSSDLQEEDQRHKTKPPLPISPSSQRKPPPKETAPSIRIMIQRYNKKINEEGPVSGASSGTSSPPWRSPKSERKRPLDMPVGVNIRNNPFLEREVQKSASACQLSRRDQNSADKCLTPTTLTIEGVLKSHSANALHPEQEKECNQHKSQEIVNSTTASTDTTIQTTTSKIELTEPDRKGIEMDTNKKERSSVSDKGRELDKRGIAESESKIATELSSLYTEVSDINKNRQQESTSLQPILRQKSETIVPVTSKPPEISTFDRSISAIEPSKQGDAMVARLSERAARIKAAKEKFFFSTTPMRREGTSSASDLRPGDRSSRVSCESEVAEGGAAEPALGRSASTGMVNVDRDAWHRLAEGTKRDRPKSRFSLARLAAKIRRKEESTVSRLCRQSLLVQLRK